MSGEPPTEYHNAFRVLRQFARRKSPLDGCELCGAPIAQKHAHLLEPASRKIHCACQACSILFSENNDKRFRKIPERVLFLSDFAMTDGEWDGMLIPIGMAFFFKSSVTAKVVALYPGPGGATESLLRLDTWNEIAERNPALGGMEPDVEALLANRLGPSRGFESAEYYLLPIDECYKLVGMIRSEWRGLSGGSEVWESLRAFFAGLKERSQTLAGDVCA
jgi:hypothetical protein